MITYYTLSFSEYLFLDSAFISSTLCCWFGQRVNGEENERETEEAAQEKILRQIYKLEL